jgi:carboxymethylenebutenolidase
MPITTQTIAEPDRYGYLAQPEGGARGGVVLLPTIFGVNEFARTYAETLANAGLVCVVWDIYSGQPLPSGYEEAIKRARQLTDAPVKGMIGRWIDHLHNDLRLANVGVLGFCIGGRFAILQAAGDRRLKACALVYPSIENPRLPNQEMDSLALAAEIACPVLDMQPGKDHVSSVETYRVLHGALHKRSTATVVHYYPEAEHGFMHRKEPAENRAATALASPQLVAFLRACLA